jgi:microcystin-dependent protein
MPSTYTGSGIELIGDGEQSGSWGNTTNNNLEIINRLVSEAGTIALAGTTHTLSIADGTLSDGQYAVLVFGGAPSGTNTVTISPNDAKRVFIVKNSSGQSVTLTQGSGGNVTVTNGKTAIVYCDGAGAVAAVVNVSEDFVSATLSAIGSLTPTDGNFIVGNGSTWVAETGNTVLQSIGVTATTTELNTLDGITATTVELNYTDGVTSNIQTQLNDKQPLDADLTAIGALAKTDGNFIVGNGSTWVAESGNTVLQSIGVTATASELNIMDGVTATTAEINTLDGIAPSGAGFGFIPSGGIILWSGSVASVPSGWFLCNGSNGTPDLRNRFVVGAGDTYAVDATGGADSVTLDASQMPAHTHTFSGSTNTTGAHTHTVPNGNSGGASTVILNGNARSNDTNTSTSSAGDHSHTFSGTTASTGGGTSHENRPPYYALAYIMKA